MSLANRSDTRLFAQALWLCDHRLSEGVEPDYDSAVHAICLRMRRHGFLDDRNTSRHVAALCQNPPAFLDLIEELCDAMFVMREGLPILRNNGLPRRLMRVLDPDALVCLHPEFKPPEGEWFDWAGVPDRLANRIPGLDELETVDTHIHLGGALPPLYYWVMMMSGQLTLSRIHQPKNIRNSGANLKRLDRWLDRVRRACIRRLQLAWRVYEMYPDSMRHVHRRWPEEGHPYFLGAPLDRLDHIPVRELCWYLGRPLLSNKLERNERPFADPLRTPSPDNDRVHFAEGERRLMCALKRALHDRATTVQERAKITEDLLAYLKVRNAFHRMMVHDEGYLGLYQFRQITGQRTSHSALRKATSSRSRRRKRSRRLLRVMERDRMRAALTEQITRPYHVERVDQLKHGLEMRVSLPGKGSATLLTLRAWLAGIADHVHAVAARHPQEHKFQRELDELRRLHGSENLLASLANKHCAVPLHIGLVVHVSKSTQNAGSRALITFRRLTHILEEYPGLRSFLVGVDAAGDERATEPRQLSDAFSFVREFQENFRPYAGAPPVRLGFTYHVGEDCDDMLLGLRHLDEVSRLILPEEGGRLGHALILGADPYRFYSMRGGQSEVRRGALLLSLAWAHNYLKDNGQDGYRKRLESMIRELYSDVKVEHIERYTSLSPKKGENQTLRKVYENYVEKVGLCQPEWDLLKRMIPAVRAMEGRQVNRTEWRNEFVTIDPDQLWLDMLSLLQKKLCENLAKRAICVEANPTSNLLIGRYPHYHRLPYQTLLDAGMSLSLNTDDPGMFMTTLPGELAAMYDARKTLGDNHRQALGWLEARCRDSRQSSFLPRHPITLRFDKEGAEEQRTRLFSTGRW